MRGSTQKELNNEKRKKDQKKRKGVVRAGILIGLAAMMGISGTMAYLTDFKFISNQFIMGDVKIKIEEPSFDHTKPMESVLPSQVIAKDPMITNVGENDAYVFVEILVPYIKMVRAAEDGTVDFSKDEDELREKVLFFDYEPNEKDWVFIKDREVFSDNGTAYCGYRVSYYGYKKPLAPGETTTPVFTSVKIANFAFLENMDPKTPIALGVQGRAIQSENTGGDSEDPAERVKHAWEVYLRQDQDGAE